MVIIQASRKWLESLYPSSDKRQRTADHVSKRPRGMTDAEVEKKIREVVVARFYSLAKVNWIYPSYLVSSQYRTFRTKSFLLHCQASVTLIMLPRKSLTRQFPVFTSYGNLNLQDIHLVLMWYAIWCLVEHSYFYLWFKQSKVNHIRSCCCPSRNRKYSSKNNIFISYFCNTYITPIDGWKSAHFSRKRGRLLLKLPHLKVEHITQFQRYYYVFRSQAFTDEDIHHTWTISASALHEILNEHAFRMTSDQFSHIWNQLPKNSEGRVDYRDFLKMFSTRTDVTRSASATPPHSRVRREKQLTAM